MLNITLCEDDEKIIELLKPKIKSVLHQTHKDNRKDLEQELYLHIIKKIRKNDFESSSFFTLIENSKRNKT